MNESARLAIQLDKSLNGEAWHGPSWRDVLEGVTHEAAVCRPIPEAHTIAEIVLHSAGWLDVVRRRLNGESPQVSDAEDWPPVTALGAETWAAARERLFESGRALSDTIRAFPPQRLPETRPGLTDTWYDLILGILQHGLYHAGQVGVLKKAAVRVAA